MRSGAGQVLGKAQRGLRQGSSQPLGKLRDVLFWTGKGGSKLGRAVLVGVRGLG